MEKTQQTKNFAQFCEHRAWRFASGFAILGETILRTFPENDTGSHEPTQSYILNKNRQFEKY